MSLDPEMRRVIEAELEAGFPPVHSLTPDRARHILTERRALVHRSAEQCADVRDAEIQSLGGSIRIRLYTPRLDDALPVLLYFHGGGWVLGDLETADPQCRALANRTGCQVVSVDYRRPPESKFPRAAEDAHEAVLWAIETASAGGRAGHVAVAGDSAGGNLAVAATLMARDRGEPLPKMLLLVYPVLDYRFDRSSYTEYGDGLILTAADMRWFWDQYLDDPAAGMSHYASPLRADLHGLPQTVVITAECDVLRDEGLEFVYRLRAAGVDTQTLHVWNGAHGFFGMPRTLQIGADAIEFAAQAVRAAFGSSAPKTT